MNNKQHIAVIGAANIDIIGSARDSIVMEDSNPGSIYLCAGGVGRNISENLARLGADVRFVCALGDDAFGQKITALSEEAGIDMSCCYIQKDGNSSAYMAILDNDGEMRLALSDMRIADELPKDAIGRHKTMIESAALIVLDANLPEPTIDYILDTFPKQRTLIDPVSIGKAKNIKNLIGRFDTIKMNRLEAGFLSGAAIENADDLRRAGEFFINKGVRRIFITMGADGVFYQNMQEHGRCESPYFAPANATGAGDAFTAAVAFCFLQGYDDSYTARFACAMSRITLKSLRAVSPDMSLHSVSDEMARF